MVLLRLNKAIYYCSKYLLCPNKKNSPNYKMDFREAKNTNYLKTL